MHIDIHEQTEDNLLQLIKRVIAGEEIIFDRNDTSLAELIPLQQDVKSLAVVGSGKVK